MDKHDNSAEEIRAFEILGKQHTQNALDIDFAKKQATAVYLNVEAAFDCVAPENRHSIEYFDKLVSVYFDELKPADSESDSVIVAKVNQLNEFLAGIEEPFSHLGVRTVIENIAVRLMLHMVNRRSDKPTAPNKRSKAVNYISLWRSIINWRKRF